MMAKAPEKTPRAPRSPKPAATAQVVASDDPANVTIAGDIHFYVNPTYVELPTGDDDGVMRAEVGDYVVTDADGVTSVMPPERFAEAYPDLAG